MSERRQFREAILRKVDDSDPGTGSAPRAHAGAEAGKCCAYNRTRQRFLSANVEAGDFPASALDTRLAALIPGSSAALWLVPFKGISPTSVRVPIDLLYLDRNCMVVEAVESFPMASADPSSAPAASVLALPANTIASAGTLRGDRLILCAPEEMKHRLQQMAMGKADAEVEPSSGANAESLARGGVGRVLQFVDRAKPKTGAEVPAVEAAAVAAPPLPELQPEAAPAVQPVVQEPAPEKPKAKGWLQKLLSSEPKDARKANREALPGLSAYFFNGGDSVPQAIRDVSTTGMFVLTEERWYPGTVIRMTLTDRRQPTAERSITVYASVVRWGNEGVGLQFIFADQKDARRGSGFAMEGMLGGANRGQVDQFLQRIKNGERD